MKSTLLKNCRILQEGKLVRRHIYLEDSKIAYISEEIIAADEVIDLKELLVIPGMIDCHVHFREPGLTQKEDFLSGSMAAASGGVTSIIDMPNTLPPTTTVQLLDEKRKLAEKSIVNYGFHFGTDGDNLEEIKSAKNIASVKIYLNATTGNLCVTDFGKVERIMQAAPFCALHAEEQSLQEAISMASRLNKRFYAAHISSAAEIQMIKKAKKRPFVEVTPHHLFLDESYLQGNPMLGKVKPLLKAKKDQEALWQAIKNGIVDTIGTDHAPHLAEEKLSQESFGFPGVETALPLLMDAMQRDLITLEKAIELTSANPARIFQISNKGKLAEGYDADLVAIDLEMEKEVKASGFFSKSRWSPFEGKLLKGWPVYTFVNGNLVFSHGKIHDIKAKELLFEPRQKKIAQEGAAQEAASQEAASQEAASQENGKPVEQDKGVAL
ncbi:amidohydrolase family protein [Candidatus Woesearchaeota archaeon]|nr:amidohydrolase family protein [Candidatus Woesearchaeota archaeon]